MTETTNFCIIRCDKLKTRGNMAASIEHNFRTRETLNADPARTHLNRTIGGQSKEEIFALLDPIHRAANEASLAVYGKKSKTNSIKALEYLITASPAWLANQTPAGVDAFFDDCQRWLVERHGAENVLSTTVQFDEGSPHMCAYVAPISAQGTLSSQAFVDGPSKLKAMQTDFAKKVGAPRGLARGIEGSKAKHERVDHHYGALNQADVPQVKTVVPRVRKPTVAERVLEKAGRTTEHSEAVARADAAKKRRAAEIRARDAVLVAKAAQLDIERGKLAAHEARTRDATFAREIPLKDVMAALGATQSDRDKRNWDTAAGRVSIGNEKKDGGLLRDKFFNQDAGVGGGGAIDLVMHVEGIDFKAAKKWLLDHFGGQALEGQLVAAAKAEVAQLAAEPLAPYEPPAPAPDRWQRVRGYLVDVRRLAARLVDALHDFGWIYADSRSNAVFQLGPEPGVELRGTGVGVFKGVRGKKGVFVLAAIGDDMRVAFVESSIEAMSLRCLGFNGRVLGFAGNSPDLQLIYAGELVKNGHQVLAAFNADAAGDRMAKMLQDAVPGVLRSRPESTKDWNDELVTRSAAAVTPDVSSQPRRTRPEESNQEPPPELEPPPDQLR